MKVATAALLNSAALAASASLSASRAACWPAVMAASAAAACAVPKSASRLVATSYGASVPSRPWKKAKTSSQYLLSVA